MLTYKAMFKFVQDGVHAEILDFPGVITFGASHEEARRLLASALVDMAETSLLLGEPLPRPDPGLTDPEADLEEPIHLLLTGALGPGRSRDYSLELPQIRACTLNAPGSSHCGIAVPHTTGWFRGDTLVRHSILGVVPTPRPQRGTPFAPRGPGGPFPRFNTTMGHCDSLPSISPRFVSFAWRYHRCVPCSSPSAQDLAVDHPGVFNPVLLPAGTMETARSPKFP